MKHARLFHAEKLILLGIHLVCRDFHLFLVHFEVIGILGVLEGKLIPVFARLQGNFVHFGGGEHLEGLLHGAVNLETDGEGLLQVGLMEEDEDAGLVGRQNIMGQVGDNAFEQGLILFKADDVENIMVFRIGGIGKLHQVIGGFIHHQHGNVRHLLHVHLAPGGFRHKGGVAAVGIHQMVAQIVQLDVVGIGLGIHIQHMVHHLFIGEDIQVFLAVDAFLCGGCVFAALFAGLIGIGVVGIDAAGANHQGHHQGADAQHIFLPLFLLQPIPGEAAQGKNQDIHRPAQANA